MSILFVSCTKEKPVQPNFVVIQLDDLGYDDLGISGNMLVESPCIDSLANSAMRFEQFYVNPVCAPSRASFLTGRHFMKTGVSHVHGGKDFISLDETLISEVLKGAGYSTGMWGKWHSGHSPGYYPWERGFDEAYMAQLYQHRNSSGMLNGKPVQHMKWADQVISEYAIDFMNRSRAKPFFAYLSFLSIHAPLDTPDSLKLKYMDKGLSPHLATLYGMVEHVDFYVGEVLHAIDTMGLNENTVVFLMSDNGPAIINGLLNDEDRRIRNVSGMKGYKGNLWENGVRSPLFIKWQGITQKVQSNNLVDITDIFPTIVKLAGVELSPESKEPDGVAICDLIGCGNTEGIEKVSYNYANRGWPPTDQPWSPVGTHDEYRPVPPEKKENERYETQILSVRKGAFKLLHNPGKAEGSAIPTEDYVLIDVLSDPGETNNLYTKMPDVAEELRNLLVQWWQSVLGEPASFRMPLFSVVEAGNEVSRVLAYAPVETSDGVTSCYAWLSNWKQEGDFAEYTIDIKDAALYSISLVYSGKPNGATLRASCGDVFTENKIELYEEAKLGSMDIAEGEHVLRLELMKNPAGTEVFDRLEEIRLRKRD